MTIQRALLTLAAALLSLGAPPLLAADEPEEFMPLTEPIALDAADLSVVEVGKLIYRGGLKVEPGDEEIGGISGLEWHDDALWAVSDNGRWMKIVPSESGSELRDIYGIQIGPLLDPKGNKLKRKEDGDAEAIAWSEKEGWIVAFEQDHRLLGYQDIAARATDPELATDTWFAFPSPNNGIETLAIAEQGMLACAELAWGSNHNCARVNESGVTTFMLLAPPPLAEHGGAPTDAACLDDGTCYVLFRSYKPGYGNRAAIVELAPDNTQATIAIFDAPLSRDNFEGLAVREQYGKRYLYLASDDNFNNCYESDRDNCQHTLLMKFEINQPDAPPPPVADAPEPDPQYETVNVVLETTMGEITIALETERAPITAANFLRYVEDERFDGTVFYRAMSLDREPRPNGLLQGGTQFDPKRILPGIQHEPTTETGLSHTHGAVSMAMGEPGTANGDFSIMLQDQTGLDAKPASQDPVWKSGYAVFGYVIDGMEVVAAIHRSAVDPDKGEGFMKGQMLAEPVTIVRARRAAASD